MLLLLDSLQFLCLLLAVPFLFVSTAAIEMTSGQASLAPHILGLLCTWLG